MGMLDASPLIFNLFFGRWFRLPDYRFEGLTLTGRPVQGIITADNLSEAKKKIKALADQRKIKITKIQKRRTFIYKVQRDSEKPITGEQKAFTKEEVRQALEKLGYKVVSIQPKVLDFKFKPPDTEIVTFVRVSADLLREKLPYNEILQLLINDVQHPTLREALREINNDLRQGKDSEEAFIKQERVLGKFTARMLGLASKSGNMADIYESTAKFLERNAEFKKNLKSALIMPVFTLIVLFIAVVFYVAYIFPETAELFLKLGTELPPMTAATLKLSYFLTENITFILLGLVLISVAFIYFIRTPTVISYHLKVLKNLKWKYNRIWRLRFNHCRLRRYKCKKCHHNHYYHRNHKLNKVNGILKFINCFLFVIICDLKCCLLNCSSFSTRVKPCKCCLCENPRRFKCFRKPLTLT